MRLKSGDMVTAKRLGWDEQLSAEQEFDLESYAEHGYQSDRLQGELRVIETPEVTLYLVGGQEADPDTITAAAAPASGLKSIYGYETKRWITIGGKPCADGQHCGGQKVRINRSGRVLQGPSWIRGRKVDDPKGPKVGPKELKKEKEEAKKEDKKPAEPMDLAKFADMADFDNTFKYAGAVRKEALKQAKEEGKDKAEAWSIAHEAAKQAMRDWRKKKREDRAKPKEEEKPKEEAVKAPEEKPKEVEEKPESPSEEPTKKPVGDILVEAPEKEKEPEPEQKEPEKPAEPEPEPEKKPEPAKRPLLADAWMRHIQTKYGLHPADFNNAEDFAKAVGNAARDWRIAQGEDKDKAERDGRNIQNGAGRKWDEYQRAAKGPAAQEVKPGQAKPKKPRAKNKPFDLAKLGLDREAFPNVWNYMRAAAEKARKMAYDAGKNHRAAAIAAGKARRAAKEDWKNRWDQPAAAPAVPPAKINESKLNEMADGLFKDPQVLPAGIGPVNEESHSNADSYARAMARAAERIGVRNGMAYADRVALGRKVAERAKERWQAVQAKRDKEAAAAQANVPEDAKLDNRGVPKNRNGFIAWAKSSPVRKVKNLGGGANETKIVEMANGFKGVWKPYDGEDHKLRQYITDKFYERESAASDLADVLGWNDMVPATFNHEIKGKPGSIQHFVKAKAAAAMYGEGERKYGGTPEETARAAAFDFLTGNSDRHTGNWMIRDDGSVVLIDNGLAFGPKEEYLRSFLLRKGIEKDLPIPQAAKDLNETAVEKIMKSHQFEPDVQEAIQERLSLLKECDTFGELYKKGKAKWDWDGTTPAV